MGLSFAGVPTSSAHALGPNPIARFCCHPAQKIVLEMVVVVVDPGTLFFRLKGISG